VILAADVGGTNTRLALYELDGAPRDPARMTKGASHDFPSLDALATSLLGNDLDRVTAAAIGVAGPVVENRTETTNLPWRLDGNALSRWLNGAQVRLLNDLEATAWGVSLLGSRDLSVLHEGEPSAGSRALIAAGTGLGESILVWEGTRHRPIPSEGGHTDFGPRDHLEDELSLWLRERYTRVSYERILSGTGIADLFRFFTSTKRGTAPDDMLRRFEQHPHPEQIVTETALDGSCERARLVLERWVTIYGAEAGNLALKGLAVNGVYVGGGIAPRFPEMFKTGGFVDAFTGKGRLKPVLDTIPVSLILDDRTGLWGAAAFAFAHLGDVRRTTRPGAEPVSRSSGGSP
jgi:glucokinase